MERGADAILTAGGQTKLLTASAENGGDNAKTD